MTDLHHQHAISARYLVSYDWPVTADTQQILTRLKSIVTQLGNVELLVSADVHGKEKSVTTDFLKIKDLSTVHGVETISEHGAATGLGGLFYTYNKVLDMAVLSIAIPNHQLRPGLMESFIGALHEVDGIGYTIAFDATLGKRALYYALGITFGEVRTHYERMLAQEVGRFFFQRTRKDRGDRAYNLDKIRHVYPVNVLNRIQKQGMQAITELDERRFTRLDDDRYLLVLDYAEVLGIREKSVGSDFLI